LRFRPRAHDIARKIRIDETGLPEEHLGRTPRTPVIHRVGVRYRINVKGLPGRPDIANWSRRKAIFVNGCFWYFHEGRSRGRIPKTNKRFWQDKLLANKRRNEEKTDALVRFGFKVLVVWECELDDFERLRGRIGALGFD
jgi:DNA mismatch endonuclease, patch repair protein